MNEQKSSRHADRHRDGERVRQHIGRRVQELMALQARLKPHAEGVRLDQNQTSRKRTTVGSDE